MRKPELISITEPAPRQRLSAGVPGFVRLLLRFCLAIALFVAGPGAPSHAMGAGGATMQVICGDAGAETIWLDASGAPVDKGEDCRACPDCLSPDVASGGLVVAFLPAPPPPAPALMPLPTDALPLAPAYIRPIPRGPPALATGARGPNDAVRSFRAIAPATLEFRQARRGQSVTDRRATD